MQGKGHLAMLISTANWVSASAMRTPAKRNETNYSWFGNPLVRGPGIDQRVGIRRTSQPGQNPSVYTTTTLLIRNRWIRPDRI